MLSIMKLVTFIVGILAANCTRIPMEIVQLTSTQMASNNDTHQQSDADPTVAAASTKIVNVFDMHTTFDQQQRKGRQLVDSFALHQPRILYQVGVSVDGFDRFFFFFSFSVFLSLSIGTTFSSQMSTSASVSRRSIDTTVSHWKKKTEKNKRNMKWYTAYSNRLPQPNTLQCRVTVCRPFSTTMKKKKKIHDKMIWISCRQHLWSVGCRSCAFCMTLSARITHTNLSPSHSQTRSNDTKYIYIYISIQSEIEKRSHLGLDFQLHCSYAIYRHAATCF